MDQEQTNLLKDYSAEEKGAYFGALATMASADGHTSEEELEFLRMMSQAAELSEKVQQEVVQIAQNPSVIDLRKCLDVLKGSQLRFSFVTDIISFAKSDGQYSNEEQQKIGEIATYLGIDQKQYSILDEFVNKADEAKQRGEDPTSTSFLNQSGFSDMFKKAGISPAMVTGLLGMLAPIVISKMIRGGRQNYGGGGSMMGGMGGLGGLLGGVLGGGGARGGMSQGGGLGSIISVLGGLGGKRGYGGGMGAGGLGSLLGGLFGGKRGGGSSGW